MEVLGEEQASQQIISVVPITQQHRDAALNLISESINSSFRWEFRHPDSERKRFMEGMPISQKIIDDEVNKQRQQLLESLDQKAPNRKYFAAVSSDGHLHGIMGYDTDDTSNEIIQAAQNLPQPVVIGAQVISAYINPESQRKGIARQLFKTILDALAAEKIEHFALFSGYEQGQIAWTRILGTAPDVSILNYLNDGADCWVWFMETKKAIEKLADSTLHQPKTN